MGGKGGGAWKVAYADFVTAMMAFFMVMWLTSQKPATKNALGSYFRDPWAKSRLNTNDVRTPTLREVKAGETSLGKEFMGSHATQDPHDEPESLESKKPKITTVRSTDRTAIGTVVLFAEGSTELSEEGRRKLRDLLPKIVDLSFKLEIRGHATQREQYLAGDSGDAWKRCYQRSLAVAKYLVELGVEEQRLRLCQASGYEPLALGAEPKQAAENVRVDVFMLTEMVKSTARAPLDPQEESAETEPSPAAEPHAAPAH